MSEAPRPLAGAWSDLQAGEASGAGAKADLVAVDAGTTGADTAWETRNAADVAGGENSRSNARRCDSSARALEKQPGLNQRHQVVHCGEDAVEISDAIEVCTHCDRLCLIYTRGCFAP